MNIILLGHGDIASKIALRFIVSQLPEHNYKLFLSGPPAAGETPPPEPLAKLSMLDKAFYDSLPRNIDSGTDELPAPNSSDGLAALRAFEPDLFRDTAARCIKPALWFAATIPGCYGDLLGDAARRRNRLYLAHYC